MYQEGKSLVEKVIKETFNPDEAKKSNKVIKDFVSKQPNEDERFERGSETIEEEPGGGVYEPSDNKTKVPFGRGAVVHQK